MKEIQFEDIPDGKNFEDYPEDTVFIFKENEEDDEWFPEELKRRHIKENAHSSNEQY